MTLRLAKGRLLLLFFVILFYGAVLNRNMNEGDRRSLQFRKEAPDTERVFVDVTIVGVDMQRSELTARLRFRVAGAIAEDEFTPSADLRLLLNSIRGNQEVEFGKGKRLNSIEVVFPLEGDSNRYPFDLRQANVALLITTPGHSPRSSSTAVQSLPAAEEVLAGPVELERRRPVAVSLNLTASIPGVRFEAELPEAARGPQTEVRLKVRRAGNLIIVSVIIMVMMLGLAFSLLAMVLYATQKGKETVLLPLSVAVSLIFGLPALRNTQPGVPPLGAFSDYVAFLWAELIVAGCTVIVIWTWILRSHQRALAKASEEALKKPSKEA